MNSNLAAGVPIWSLTSDECRRPVCAFSVLITRKISANKYAHEWDSLGERTMRITQNAMHADWHSDRNVTPNWTHRFLLAHCMPFLWLNRQDTGPRKSEWKVCVCVRESVWWTSGNTVACIRTSSTQTYQPSDARSSVFERARAGLEYRRGVPWVSNKLCSRRHFASWSLKSLFHSLALTTKKLKNTF